MVANLIPCLFWFSLTAKFKILYVVHFRLSGYKKLLCKQYNLLYLLNIQWCNVIVGSCSLETNQKVLFISCLDIMTTSKIWILSQMDCQAVSPLQDPILYSLCYLFWIVIDTKCVTTLPGLSQPCSLAPSMGFCIFMQSLPQTSFKFPCHWCRAFWISLNSVWAEILIQKLLYIYKIDHVYE